MIRTGRSAVVSQLGLAAQVGLDEGEHFGLDAICAGEVRLARWTQG
jgi:hypothetical protein